MGKKLKSSKIKKFIVAGILFTLILGLLLSSYFVVHSYINKINIVKTQPDTVSAFSGVDEVSEIEPEPEDNPEIPDFPKEDIARVEDKIQKNVEKNSTPMGDNKDVFNILLIGSDTRSSNDRGRSDAMIIISLNEKMKTITATSIMRDIYLQIPGRENNRINTSYAYGGADLLMDTIEQNFKIHIDRYVSVDFSAFIDVVDAIGGVSIDLSKKELSFIGGDMKLIDGKNGQINVLQNGIEVQPGTYFLDGEQTLSYVRIRHIGNNDFDRTERQRKILREIFMIVKDVGRSKLSELLKTIAPEISTNLSEGEIFSLILDLPKLSGYDLKECRIPLDGTYSFLRIRGMSVLGIDFEENNDELYKVIYGDFDE